ncbi:hypothetical protein ACQPZG_01180 (plasmid) [Streptomyces sp. CA-294286]|uniref:hypothetical protein n=1 Tax=Streptomyces sp. CA-294286 TaxID=3240070 RepID=UPI003D8AFE35
MSGIHARPTYGPFRSAPAGEAAPHGARRGRRDGFGRRLRLRLLAYREIEFCSTRIPGGAADAPGGGLWPEEDCLLFVHGRKVVGQIHYRTCTPCGEGVITGIDISAHLRSTGIGTRALSHLRARHPGVSWHSTLTRRTTRDLLRRMGIPSATPHPLCVHADRTAAQEPGPQSSRAVPQAGHSPR